MKSQTGKRETGRGAGVSSERKRERERGTTYVGERCSSRVVEVKEERIRLKAFMVTPWQKLAPNRANVTRIMISIYACQAQPADHRALFQ